MSLSRFEETLLQSGARDAPSPDRRRAAREAALRAAGVSTLLASAAMTTSTSAAGAGATTSITVAPATVKVLTLTKLLISASALIGAAAITVAVVSSSSPISPAASTTRSAEIATALPPAPRSPSAELREIPVVPASAVPPATSASRPRERSPKPAPPALPEDEVGVEAQLLHSARRCLAAGDQACARARLAEHDGRFGRTGALAEEAALLAIDVALAEGRTGEARRLAREAVSQRPQGTLPARVRKLADESRE